MLFYIMLELENDHGEVEKSFRSKKKFLDD